MYNFDDFTTQVQCEELPGFAAFEDFAQAMEEDYRLNEMARALEELAEKPDPKEIPMLRPRRRKASRIQVRGEA